MPVGAPRETKSAVARLLDDDSFRVGVARAAVTLASHLTWGHAAEELLSTYRQTIEARVGRLT